MNLRKIASRIWLKKIFSVKIAATAIISLFLSFAIALLNNSCSNSSNSIVASKNGPNLLQSESRDFLVEFGKRENPSQPALRFSAVPEDFISDNFYNLADKEIPIAKKFLEKLGIKEKKGVEFLISEISIIDAGEKIRSTFADSLRRKLGDVDEEILKKEIDEIFENSQTVSADTSLENDEEGGQIVLNESIAEGIDLRYKIIDGRGVKEEIVLYKPAGIDSNCVEDAGGDAEKIAENCGLPKNAFSFDLKLDPGVNLEKSIISINAEIDELWYLVDDYGRYIAHFEPLFAEDSAKNRTNDVSLKIENDRAVVILDLEWLTSPDRVYPIIIDPSIVHDTQADFQGGIENRLITTADPKVELRRKELPATIRTAGLWHLNETANGTCSPSGDACDSSLNANNGARTGTTIETTNQLLGSAARNFNGSSDYIDFGNPSSLDLTKNFTIEAWINPTSVSGTQGIVTKVLDADSNQYSLSVVNGVLVFDYELSGNNFSTSGGAISAAQWQHVSASISNNLEIKLYINGKEVQSVTAPAETVKSATNVIMGRWGGSISSNYFNGLIDEIRISNTALTPVEIAEDATHYPYGVYISETLDLGADVLTVDDLQWTEAGVATGDGETLYSSTNLVGQWNFNESSGASVADASGEGNSGTLTGFLNTTSQDAVAGSGWTAEDRRWGTGALMVDGTNDYVRVSDSLSLDVANAVTVEAWVKLDKNAVDQRIVDKWSTGGQAYLLSTDDGDGNKFTFGANGVSCDSDATRLPGRWYHVVGTYDDSSNSQKIYINGQLDNEVVNNTGTITNSTGDLILGASNNSPVDLFLNGTLDSVRVYSRTLSETEILSNYQAGDVEFQTRTSADGSTWDNWMPSASESQISSLDADFRNWEFQTPTIPSVPIIVDNVSSTLLKGPSGCTNYVPILVNNLSNSSTLTNYQLNFQVEYLTGMASDFSDLRFTNDYVDAYANLDYWIEDYTASTIANIWVEIDSIPANTNLIIYMWYNGCTGGNGSNGDNTFEFFDDFNDNNLDMSKWETYSSACTITEENQELHMDAGSSGRCDVTTVTATFPLQRAFRAKMKRDDNGTFCNWSVMFTNDSGGTSARAIDDSYLESIFWSNNSNNVVLRSTGGADTTVYGSDLTIGTWYIGEVIRTSSTTAKGYLWDENYKELGVNSHTLTSSSNSLYTAIFDGGSSGDTKTDYAFVRKYTDPEPFAKVGIAKSVPKIQGDGSLLFNFGQSFPDYNTAGLWHLDETNGDLAGYDVFDETTNNLDGEFNGSGINTAVVNGISGKARSLNGSDDYIDLGNNSLLNPSNAMTIEAWVNLDAVTGEDWFVARDISGSQSYAFGIDGNSSNRIALYINGLAKITNVAGTELSTGKWHYVAATGDSASGWKVYIDGVEKASVAWSTPSAFSENTYIGRRGFAGSEGYLDGIIDEVRISNIARPAQTIAENYRLGREHYFSRTISSTNLSSKTKLPVYFAGNRPGTYAEITFGETDYSSNLADANTSALWRFEESSDYCTASVPNCFLDSSGNGNHGTPSSSPYNVQGKIGRGWYFDGTDDYIDTNSSISLGNFTVDAWFKAGSDVTVNRAIIDKETSAGAPWNYRILISQTTGTLLADIHDGTNNPTVSSDVAVNDNEWHHAAFVRDTLGTSLNLYLDGKLVNSTTDTTNGNEQNSQEIWIGRSPLSSGSYPFSGVIDEVRISSTVRSAAEIRKLYELETRSHPVTVDFTAKLDSGNLISGSGDISFTVDATYFGLPSKGANLYFADQIIVSENYGGTEYLAEGTVSSIDSSTGAATVVSWEPGSTFPSGGFTQNAEVFKWQKELIDTQGPLDIQLDAVTKVNLHITDGNEGRSVWLDEISSAGPYLTNPLEDDNVTSTDQQYLQYRFFNSSYDALITPYVASVTLNYSSIITEPPNDLLMRHGKYFLDGEKQGYWWAQ